MFAFLDSPVEIGIVVLVILLLFGGSQLPKLAKNLGQAQKEFKDGLSAGQQADAAKAAAKDAAAAQVAQASAAQAVGAAPQIPVVPPPAVPATDAARAEELRQLEARMAELKGEPPAPSAN